jgi:hypothetical protein
MITFFACPKPFLGHIDIIQRNAIKSWTLLKPKPEIILLGNEDGVGQVCKEFGLIHVAEVERNEYGTPLVNSIFKIAQERAYQPVVCYINSDIILMSDFMQAFKTIAAQISKYLILGQRWDLDLKEAWNFAAADWEADMKALLARKGKLHPPTGIDFFCFPRGMYTDIPPFAIGRLAWDNWLVWRARMEGLPLVDVTDAVTVIHQNHEYAASAIRRIGPQKADRGNQKHDSGSTKWFDGHWVGLGPEAQRNIELVPDAKNLNIWAATWMVDKKGKVRRRRLTLTISYLFYQLKCVAPLYWPTVGRLIRWMLKVSEPLIKRTKIKLGKAKLSDIDIDLK